MDGDPIWKHGPDSCDKISNTGHIGDVSSYTEIFDWTKPKAEQFIRHTIRPWLKSQPNFRTWIEMGPHGDRSDTDLWYVLTHGDGDQFITSFTIVDRYCVQKVEKRLDELESFGAIDKDAETPKISARGVLLSFVYKTILAEIKKHNKDKEELDDSGTELDLYLDLNSEKEEEPGEILLKRSSSTTQTQLTSFLKARKPPQRESRWEEKVFRIHYGTREKDIPIKECLRQLADGTFKVDHEEYQKRLRSAPGWSKKWEMVWEYDGKVYDFGDSEAFEAALAVYKQFTEARLDRFWDLHARVVGKRSKIAKRKLSLEAPESEEGLDALGGTPESSPKRARLEKAGD